MTLFLRVGVGVIVATVLVAGCERLAPLSPTPVAPVVDADLAVAWDMVDVPVAVRVRRVIVRPLQFSGYWDATTGSVIIGSHVLESPAVVIAGIMVHELAHADLMVHSCGTNPIGWTDDRTLDGAWGRQAEFLARHGRPDVAEMIRRFHICDVTP